ncbi:MAG: hypothetical protein HY049_19155 [Acidobacteria bacterium]|nr:hypothetical protein [Acidobacteriota bacterium]
MRVMTTLGLALVLFAPSGSALAGEARADFEDASGRVRARITINDPAGDVGLDHFEAFHFGLRAVERSQGALKMTSASRRSVSKLDRSKLLRAVDGSGRLLVNWSGVTATVHIESVGQCIAGIYGTVEGTIERGKSGYVVVENTMSHVSVLTTLRGDADLYVYDGAGTLVCASEMTKVDRLPDQCAYLASDCGTYYVPVSLVEVRGLRSRNDFQLTIWAVDAI